jgi:hypothetical protein
MRTTKLKLVSAGENKIPPTLCAAKDMTKSRALFTDKKKLL